MHINIKKKLTSMHTKWLRIPAAGPDAAGSESKIINTV